MNSRSNNALKPSAPGQAPGSLSSSDSNTSCAPQSSSPQQSNLQPLPTHSDQLQEVLKLAEDVVSHKLRFTPDDEPIKFTISRESWLKLQEDSNFDLCIERKLFRDFFDSSLSLITIMSPPSYRHQTVLKFLTQLAGDTRSNLISTLASKISVKQGSAIRMVTGDYVSAQKIPDLFIRWRKSMGDNRIHTIIEVGQTQSLSDLRRLAPFYLNNNADIQRVILIKMTETPTFKSPVSTEVSQEFRRDETTGVIWCGTAKVIGTPKILWEVWERDTTGVPESIFQETFAFGEIPSRNLPFLKISKGTYGDTAIRREIDISIKPQKMKEFWTNYWVDESWEDAYERVYPLGIRRVKGADMSIQPSRVGSGSLCKQAAIVIAIAVAIIAIAVVLERFGVGSLDEESEG
ncbi:hypothetical protein AYL99_11835 [Fonsecaea erecta]|uniref:Uncharacterized protein n=1 Tax=Fonsecaea erecta TaxID=1367422 RepID=A0A178Z4D0_9EURO|nr:hypothetical protein AYL99_11835 [Fonsecaea erecta]OAP53955.1 hypothetical protein AYL99_11835 [Fonsecaea erecta]